MGLLAWASPSAAGDLGTEPVFNHPPAISLITPVSTENRVVYDSGQSAAITESWDTVLFHGRSSQRDVVFEASRADAAGNWEAWTEVPVKFFANGRFWGKAKFKPGLGPVRLRARVSEGPVKPVEIYGVEVFSSVESRARSQGNAPPPSFYPIPRPAVYSRVSWGAAPPKEAYVYHAPVRITLHHTAGSYPKNLEESFKEVRFIQDFHQNGRNWSDIAYHFLIDAQGNIFEGRPETVEGAHTLDNNPGNIGIALLGAYHPPKNNVLTAVEKRAIIRIGRYLVAQYGIDPDSLRGHRDYRPTECPGDIAYALMGSLRRELGNTAAAHSQRRNMIDWGQVQPRAIIHKALGVSAQIMAP